VSLIGDISDFFCVANNVGIDQNVKQQEDEVEQAENQNPSQVAVMRRLNGFQELFQHCFCISKKMFSK
jgi:hypothetical protein